MNLCGVVYSTLVLVFILSNLNVPGRTSPATGHLASTGYTTGGLVQSLKVETRESELSDLYFGPSGPPWFTKLKDLLVFPS